jgi:MoxR-like ATPase
VTEPTAAIPDRALLERLARARDLVDGLLVGQEAVTRGLWVALLAGGHCLLEGMPGVGKTLAVRALAIACGLELRRVQFTPDLLPADITGGLTWQAGQTAFAAGPLFTQMLLADELNRTPPKTQAALLEAMEEGRVTVDGVTRALPEPFFVVATQNPEEFQGTYPLPESQRDRFLLRVVPTYPDAAAERALLARVAEQGLPRQDLDRLTPALDAAAVRDLRRATAAVRVAGPVLDYVASLARASRADPAVRLGVSPRGAIALLLAARAAALLDGRDHVLPEDVKQLVPAVFGHRLLLRPEAELDGVDVSRVLADLVDATPVVR